MTKPESPADTCEGFCRSYRIYFILIPVIGFALFCCANTFCCVSESDLGGSTIYAIAVISKLDAFIIPRSIMEFGAVREHRGFTHFLLIFLMDTLSALVGLSIVIAQAWRVRSSSLYFELTSWKKIVGYLIVILAFLIFRQANFQRGSYLDNFIDVSGFYILRESFLISVAYYQIGIIVVNLCI